MKQKANSGYEIFAQWMHSNSELEIEKIIFTGGECTLNPYLKEMIKLSKEKEIPVAIFTNGISIPSNILDICDEYYVSLDGNEKIHNLIRGNENAYNQTINSLNVLDKLNKKIVIQTTINKWNIHHLNQLIPIYKEFITNLEQISLEGVVNEGGTIENSLGLNENEVELVKKFKGKILEELSYKVWVKDNLYSQDQIKQFLVQRNVYFPLWVDLVRKQSYLFKENFAVPFNCINCEMVEKVNEGIKTNIVSRLEKQKEKWINIENLLLKY